MIVRIGGIRKFTFDVSNKKCPQNYFIAKLREFVYKGKFETEEDFADTIVPCYDWTTWRAFSPSITHAVHGIWTDCTFCNGHVPLKHKKTRKRGESPVPFVINEKFRWQFLFRAEVNIKSMVQSSISDERTMLFIPSDNLIFCPKVHQMFWSVQMGLHRKTLSQVPW